MSILVTGGAGFIGSHFIEMLLARTERPIVCLDNYNDYYDPALKRQNTAAYRDNPRVTMVEGDFCDFSAMGELFARHQFDHVVHLGAYAGLLYMLSHGGVVFASQVSYIVTPAAVMWGVVLLAEDISLSILLALVLIMGGLALIKPRRKDEE